jgi:hypothetical protein
MEQGDILLNSVKRDVALLHLIRLTITNTMLKACLTAAVACGFLLTGLKAQHRFLDEVFTEVELTVDVEYGSNAMLPINDLLLPVKAPLLADVYQPVGDTAAKRPLAILVHAGHFLPKEPSISLPYGAKDDSCLVYLAHRLARRGYVVAVMNNRTGWNPINPDMTWRRFSFANALYRGIQDVNTCVRFFKKSAADYQIAPDQIMLWGDGSGGMMALGAAHLESTEEWQVAQFFTPFGPMVQESINGDVFATSEGVVPPGYPGIPAGTVLCYPNHEGYDSRVELVVSMGGNLIDTAWVHAGEPALIAFLGQPDLTQPYSICGPSDHPPFFPQFYLYESCGSLAALSDAFGKGNNDVFEGRQFPGDFSVIANSRNSGVDGLFPLAALHDTASNAPLPYPWRWWSDDWAPGSIPVEVAKPYLDTMLAYVAPRACLALGLDCPGVTNHRGTSTAYPAAAISFAPNPASGRVEVRLPAEPAQAGLLRLLDIGGRLLRQTPTMGPQIWLELNGLPGGVYLVSWMSREQLLVGKLVVR